LASIGGQTIRPCQAHRPTPAAARPREGAVGLPLFPEGRRAVLFFPSPLARHRMLCRLRHPCPSPGFDFLTKPQPGALGAAVHHWTWHVWIAVKVGAGAVGVTQAKKLSYFSGVDQILCAYRRAHHSSLNLLTAWRKYAS
jgi:hypothetical protein